MTGQRQLVQTETQQLPSGCKEIFFFFLAEQVTEHRVPREVVESLFMEMHKAGSSVLTVSPLGVGWIQC